MLVRFGIQLSHQLPWQLMTASTCTYCAMFYSLLGEATTAEVMGGDCRRWSDFHSRPWRDRDCRCCHSCREGGLQWTNRSLGRGHE